MAKKKNDNAESPTGSGGDSAAGTATAKPRRAVRSNPKPPKMMPPWKVLLHNDDVNDMGFVVNTIVELTPLGPEEAMQRMKEAHDEKLTLLLVTHKERAELYKDQFHSKGLTVSIEPAEE